MSVLLFFMASIVNGQITQTNTQFPNPGFEKWSNHSCTVIAGSTSEVPDNWHTFDEIKYDVTGLASLGEGTAKTTCHYKLSGNNAHGGSGNSLQIASHNVDLIITTVLANGTITSGRTRVGSTSVSNYQNYNFSQLTLDPNESWPSYGNQRWYWDFIGCPDSMSFYYMTNWTSTSQKPLIKVYLHRGTWYDHASNVVNSTPSGQNNDLTQSITAGVASMTNSCPLPTD